VAVGHSILVIVYHLLKHPDSLYQDLGMHYYDRRDQAQIEKRLVKRLESLGYTVILEPNAA
jgi:hypothetical protein